MRNVLRSCSSGPLFSAKYWIAMGFLYLSTLFWFFSAVQQRTKIFTYYVRFMTASAQGCGISDDFSLFGNNCHYKNKAIEKYASAIVY